jgi:hypothetical protein
MRRRREGGIGGEGEIRRGKHKSGANMSIDPDFACVVGPMPLLIELLIAGVVSVGVIAVGEAIVTELRISRRRRHHLAQQTGLSSIPEVELPPRPLSGE